MRQDLRDVLNRNLADEAVGVASWCTAHEETLRAVCESARDAEGPVLIEATSNQVNQDGGYTGLRPPEFRARVEAIAEAAGLAARRLVLGGDHLGPNPWRNSPAEDAMMRAETLVAVYASAGFVKLHLDASMALGGDPASLDGDLVADRAARLCAAAEAACGGTAPLYVVGTEVPVPGGELDDSAGVRATHPASLADTLEQHRRAFACRGLERAFTRVVAVVVQPGVDFGVESVLPFESAGAPNLGEAARRHGAMVCEAHSTDYQPEAVLAALTQAHFAILKVGPELTAAYRRAVVGLAHIEDQIIPPARRSRILDVLLRRMATRPEDWRAYYQGDDLSVRRLMLFGNSDRVRYYWADPEVRIAVARLLANLDGTAIPPLLFEQYLPDLEHPAAGTSVAAVAREAVGRVVRRYQRATGMRAATSALPPSDRSRSGAARPAEPPTRG